MLTAAGAAGLLKVLLALKHQVLAPDRQPDRSLAPRLELEGSPFRILQRPSRGRTAQPGRPRRAAISGFGFGGINAHVLIEEWTGGQASQAAESEPVSAASPAVASHPAQSPGRCPSPSSAWRPISDRFRDCGPSRNGSWAARLAASRSTGALVGCRRNGEAHEAELELGRFPGYYLDEVRLRVDQFRIPPRELEEMLPQQSLMLKVAAEAIEDARWDRELGPADGRRDRPGAGPEHQQLPAPLVAGRRWPRIWNRTLELGLSDAELDRWVDELRRGGGSAADGQPDDGLAGRAGRQPDRPRVPDRRAELLGLVRRGFGNPGPADRRGLAASGKSSTRRSSAPSTWPATSAPCWRRTRWPGCTIRARVRPPWSEAAGRRAARRRPRLCRHARRRAVTDRSIGPADPDDATLSSHEAMGSVRSAIGRPGRPPGWPRSSGPRSASTRRSCRAVGRRARPGRAAVLAQEPGRRPAPGRCRYVRAGRHVPPLDPRGRRGCGAAPVQLVEIERAQPLGARRLALFALEADDRRRLIERTGELIALVGERSGRSDRASGPPLVELGASRTRRSDWAWPSSPGRFRSLRRGLDDGSPDARGGTGYRSCRDRARPTSRSFRLGCPSVPPRASPSSIPDWATCSRAWDASCRPSGRRSAGHRTRAMDMLARPVPAGGVVERRRLPRVRRSSPADPRAGGRGQPCHRHPLAPGREPGRGDRLQHGRIGRARRAAAWTDRDVMARRPGLLTPVRHRACRPLPRGPTGLGARAAEPVDWVAGIVPCSPAELEAAHRRASRASTS